MREGEGYSTDETLLASQILAFCEGMLSRFVRSEFKYSPTDDFLKALIAYLEEKPEMAYHLAAVLAYREELVV